MIRLYVFFVCAIFATNAHRDGNQTDEGPEISAPVVRLEMLQIYENPETGARVYYTDEEYAKFFPGYVRRATDPRWGFISPRAKGLDKICPALIKIFSVIDKGASRLVPEAEVRRYPGAVAAGFVAHWPGYCKSSGGSLVELYSPFKQEYAYTTNEDLAKYRVDWMNQQYRPIRVLGYMYSVASRVTLKKPWGEPKDSYVYDTIPVNLDAIRRVFKNNGVAGYSTAPRSIHDLGFKLDETVTFNYSLIQPETDVNSLKRHCGEFVTLHETYNSKTGAYRIRDLKNSPLLPGEQVVRKSGYTFLDPVKAERCAEIVNPLYEYQEKGTSRFFIAVGTLGARQYTGNPKVFDYTGFIGYASYGTFVYIKKAE
ncbi:unnamed protein product [Caenorhabditis auriculariae]|uniref:Uncharacterized protein n=1 Tax=Caenorhabditis auriculariae TaxID=2777116 RepID=A0A8S1HKW3_9PELO|nr:unnamed protein product [Caenorhabditis auriculariae]